MVSGGYRPNAPQNNPNKISATGGNGQSGRNTQPARYIPGMRSEGTTSREVYENQTKAKMQGNPTAGMVRQKPIDLDAPTGRPEEPGTAGIDRGPGIGAAAFSMDLPVTKPSAMATLQKLVQFDDSGEVELILRSRMDSGIA
jgi:hypothetical protein